MRPFHLALVHSGVDVLHGRLCAARPDVPQSGGTAECGRLISIEQRTESCRVRQA